MAERQLFTKDILMDSLGVEVKDIFCLQESPRERGYDVTMHTLLKCRIVSQDLWKRLI